LQENLQTPAIEKGKSGGFRTFVTYKELDKAIFIFGVSKAEKDNLDEDELRSLKKLAKDLLQVSTKEYLRLKESGYFLCWSKIMRGTIKQAIGGTVQDLILSGIKTSFAEKELKELGVIFPDV